MLVHICCSVDSHYFLQKVQEEFPNETLIGFFYDPNIHPYSEYRLRLLDVERSCALLGIPLVEGEYDIENWMSITKGLEEEPEKGGRCGVCFDMRFDISAKKAQELGEKTFTSTLLMSPKKSIQQLALEGKKIEAQYGVTFLNLDYRKNGGTTNQMVESKKAQLYHQNYCGCGYGLALQRKHKDSINHELFSPLNRAILLGSIEERLALYQHRLDLEERKVPYQLRKHRFINYRLLFARVLANNVPILAHVVSYSLLDKPTKTTIAFEQDGIYYFDKHGIMAITLAKYNDLLNTSHNTLLQLIYAPNEPSIREKLIPSPFSTHVILILDSIHKETTYSIEIQSRTFDDSREYLVTFG